MKYVVDAHKVQYGASFFKTVHVVINLKIFKILVIVNSFSIFLMQGFPCFQYQRQVVINGRFQNVSRQYTGTGIVHQVPMLRYLKKIPDS